MIYFHALLRITLLMSVGTTQKSAVWPTFRRNMPPSSYEKKHDLYTKKIGSRQVNPREG